MANACITSRLLTKPIATALVEIAGAAPSRPISDNTRKENRIRETLAKRFLVMGKPDGKKGAIAVANFFEQVEMRRVPRSGKPRATVKIVSPLTAQFRG